MRSPSGPSHTVRAGGTHHGVVVSNYNPGWARRSPELPLGSLTTKDGHAFLVPYSTKGLPKITSREPADTVTTLNKASLVVPYYKTGTAVPAHLEPAQTATTKARLDLVVVPPHADPAPGRAPDPERPPSDAELDLCRFRMFSVEELARAMRRDALPDGSPFLLLGNKAARTRLLGNAVVPNTMDYLVSRLLAAIDSRPDGGLRHAA